MGPLSDIFIGSLPDPSHGRDVDLDALESTLAAFLKRAREPWPDLGLNDSEFLDHAAKRLKTSEGVLNAVTQAEAGDLFLAWASATGSDSAQSRFVQKYSALIRGALGRFVKQGVDIEEIEQHIIAYLLFPRDELPPAIANYSGAGSLAGYLRVSVVREAIRTAKSLKRTRPASDAVYDAVVATDDPELEALKRRYRTEFKQSFLEALRELDQDETLLLRYHYYSNLGLREIAALTGSSKSGVGRQLAAVREKIMTETQQRLMAHVNLRQSEASSIIRLVRSQLDVGLSKFIK